MPQYLYLGSSFMSGALPEPSVWGATRLRSLVIDCSRLFAIGLETSGAGFYGTLPVSYSQLHQLANLKLFPSAVEGGIPVEWLGTSGMTSLQSLYVLGAYGQFPAPSVLGCKNLTDLYIHYVNFDDTSDELPGVYSSLRFGPGEEALAGLHASMTRRCLRKTCCRIPAKTLCSLLLPQQAHVLEAGRWRAWQVPV